MATSPLQHSPSLSLDLSLGALFSLPKIPCTVVISNNGEDQAPPVPSRHPRHRDSPVYNRVSPSHQSVSCMEGMHLQSHRDSLKRRKGLESEEIRQYMRARREEHGNEDHAYSGSLCKSCVSKSGNYHGASCLPHGHYSLQLERNMRVSGDGGSKIHRLNSDMEQSSASCCTSSVHAQAIPLCTSSSFSSTLKASCRSTSSLGSSPTPISPSLPPSSCAPPPETGSNSIVINNMLPTKRKFRRGNEEEKSCKSSSSELLENGDNLDKQSTIGSEKLVTELDAPRSRCASNSDILGSMDTSAAMPTTRRCTNPFAMVPIQVPFSVPTPWRAMHYSSHMMRPLASEIDKSSISPLASISTSNQRHKHPSSPFLPASARGSRPRVPEASCNEGKLLQDKQETFCEDNCELALMSTPPTSAKRPKVQETILGSASDECTSAASEAGKHPLRSRIRHNGSTASQKVRPEDDHNASSQISSDEGGSAAFVVDGAGKQLEGKNAANIPARVSVACAGPSGKTIHGVLNITKGKQVCLICSCHGTRMTPSQFVQHSGSTDLSNPERRIKVTGFSCAKRAL